ncbi:LysR family transcriptional regulator [Microbacterium marinilacus]|uniref:LysR substrate-binding domain-containing protein n=1 Tax=Microbacterium marinilacus TaxID=415209 RepID=A0ABP7BLR7_9MICO|nr:LysR substrate-binding domain-containing protein [Microbacterium marinilacus]MBY0688360.1 LysR family transcriptional regulator [Microbacterium marinilacus]
MPTFAQLECFIAVAEELHFGAAAERLRMTQPPLSRQIQLLERALGARLFERTSRRVQLTAAGSALLPHARSILELTARARAEVHAAAEGLGGIVSISYTSIAAQSVLGEIVRAASAALPDVTLDLREHVTVDQLALLRSGAVDLALLRPAEVGDGLHVRRIHAEPMVAVVASSHPAAGEPDVSLEELADTPLIGYGPVEARYLSELTQRILLAAGVVSAPAHTASQVATVLALAAAGMGYALVPASAAIMRRDGLAFVPLRLPGEVAALADAELNVAWRADALSPAAARVLEAASSILL